MTTASSTQCEKQMQSLSRALRHMETSYTTSRISLMALNGALELLAVPNGYLLTHNTGFFLTNQSRSQFTVRASINPDTQTNELPAALLSALSTHLGTICAFRTHGYVVVPSQTLTGEWACVAFSEANEAKTAHLAVSTLLRAYCARFQALLLKETQIIDTSCGVLHFHRGMRELTDALRIGSRTQSRTSVIRFEIENMDAIAEKFGEAAAAVTRRALAKLLRRSTRASDKVFCCGSSGFALLLPMTSQHDAEQVGQTLGQLVDAARVPFHDTEIRIDCLIGIADSDQGPLHDRDLLRAAQDRLQPLNSLEMTISDRDVEPMPMVISG